MKPIQNTNAVLGTVFFTLILLALTLPAYADGPHGGDQQKDKDFQHADKVSPPVARHEATRQVQQATKPGNHQQPIHQRPRYQQTQQVRSPQQEQGKQEGGRNNNHFPGIIHDRIVVPVPAIHYVNMVPTQEEVLDNDGSLPYGTYVSSLPVDYLNIYINGEQYAYDQGNFYKQTFSGFEVIDPTTLVFGGSFNLGIYNNSGRYVQIQFNAVNNGFVGPQGEFYAQFPQINQLRMMY